MNEVQCRGHKPDSLGPERRKPMAKKHFTGRATLVTSLLLAAAVLAITGCTTLEALTPPTNGKPLASLKTSIAFQDITDSLGDAGRVMGWGGLAAFDYDNDGDIDLLITNGPGMPNRLFENDGHANFTEVLGAAGLAAID